LSQKRRFIRQIFLRKNQNIGPGKDGIESKEGRSWRTVGKTEELKLKREAEKESG
jgi:hypothetical protein